MQPCTQEKNIENLQKSFNESDKRDALQNEQIAMIKKDIKGVEEKVDRGFQSINDKFDNYTEKLEKMLEKKAGVWVEWTIRRIGWIVLWAVVLAMVWQVLVTK